MVADVPEETVGEGETVLVLDPEGGVEGGLVALCGVVAEVPGVVVGVEGVLEGGLVIVP